MKKKVYGYKLSRGRGARKALFSSLVRELIRHGSIQTTMTKARAVQREAEKMIVLAKKNTLSSRRTARARLANDRKSTDALFGHLVKLFSKRKSGFTKIVSLGRRKGDFARMARIEWTEKLINEKTLNKSLSKKKIAKEKTTEQTKGIKNRVRSLVKSKSK